nr:insecticidal protein IPD113 [Gymnocarpium dryopteris]
MQMQKGTAVADVRASDWNNRIRDAVLKLSSKIPEVGTAASILIGFLWPENKIDVFQAIKADVINLVKKEILASELNRHHSEIDGLKLAIQRYKAAQTHEKACWLTSWITKADSLSLIFRQSTNNIHLILPLITLALLHLTGLRERLDFGKTLYNEDNTKQWKEDLEQMYKTYIVDFLPDIFKKWKVWRADQVEIKAWTSKHLTTIPPFFLYEAHATVVDTVTGETKRYFKDDLNSTTHFASICQDHKTRMCNDATSDMAGGISTTFMFDKLLPDNNKKFPKYDKKVFGRMFKGPYAEGLLREEKYVPDFRTRPDRDDYSPNSGPITKVIIREWNTIDAMQFIYANRQGLVAGNASGGKRHDVDVMGNKPINGLRMGFSNGLLTYVQIMYCDGTSSDTYGNRSGWRCQEVSANGPSAYKLSSWSYKVNQGPSGTSGPGVIQLEYTPQLMAE